MFRHRIGRRVKELGVATASATVLLVSGLMMSAADAQTERTSIALGAMSAPGAMRAALRTALYEELDAVPSVRVTSSRNARYVLRGSVTRMASHRQTERLECEVSLIVADRRGGTIRFILEGRAAAHLPTDEASILRLQPEVMRAAVRGALRSLASHRSLTADRSLPEKRALRATRES